MAITRAQQAKQMLQDGGRIGFFTGMREQEQREKAANRREAAIQEQRRQTVDVRKSPTGSYDEAGLNVRKTGKDDDPYEGTTQMGIVDETPIIPIPRETTRDFREKKITPPKFPPGAAFLTNIFKKPLQAASTYDRNFFVDKVLKAGRIGITPLEFSRLSPEEQEETFDEFRALRNAGLTDAYGNLKTGVSRITIPFKKADGTIEMREQIIDNRDDSGPSEPIKLIPDPTDPTDPTDPNQTTDVFAGIAPRFAGSVFDFDKLRRQLEEEQSAADGGRIGAAEGGIMDLETGRQMYFLGKLVKKATRAVKKITKSPLGKAAILGGLAYFGSQGGGFTNLLKKGFLKDTAGEFALENLSPLKTIGIVSALSGLMATQEEEEKITDRGPVLTREQLLAIRNNPFGITAPRFEGSQFAFAADGGRIGYQEGSKEPVAKKTMPLLDMGGKEMDLREDGGFVPIGRMEKADDVPARLSKNEFVFTADAVRNAGDGDVDKGAEVMYNMMKNLESGGEVSEESQGLEGARKMFQTSKRLEEVI